MHLESGTRGEGRLIDRVLYPMALNIKWRGGGGTKRIAIKGKGEDVRKRYLEESMNKTQSSVLVEEEGGFTARKRRNDKFMRRGTDCILGEPLGREEWRRDW